ncbi:LacI family DNA-binding transcriptional regulator [Cellulomonas sp.]|uniref:LacI family DNA-binding transcriptional regulator n=1 Tax=Cellulomonas sp. TaxID=40001 RepID=UPI002587DB09|nr:LacI family DNA-binding transcriptional regulator [Cellulomonas sp.]MCR6690022.1 LacI family transcriptional regulator [Cellulomonas sp.]
MATQAAPSAGRRPTIADVARAAGVSTAVVSYALNDRRGVSGATRERVLRVADELGWRPNPAARSMRAGAQAVGLALVAGETLHGAPVLDVVATLQRALSQRGLSVDLRVVEDDAEAAELYLRWGAERRCEAVVVPNVRVEDRRLAAVQAARLRAVVVGPPDVAPHLAAVEVDDAEAYGRVARYLVDLGHTRVAAVTGPADWVRSQAYEHALRLGLVAGGAQLEVATTDGTPEGAAAAARRLLTADAPPTAIVLETDVAALAALDVARRTGLVLPWDLSVVAGADSVLCRLATPAVTSLPALGPDLGTALAEAVCGALDGGPEDAPVRVPLRVGALAVRGSTAPHAR